MKKYRKSVFIFRRDLRLEDNTGLINALENSEKVIPIFIFTPTQLEKNEYRSENALQFMISSLEELDQSLKEKNSQINIFFDEPEKAIKKLIDEEKIDAVFVNRDYTPYSIKRDNEIEQTCLDNNVDFIQNNDILLNEPEVVMNGQGEPYKVFTPFYNKSMTITVREPVKNSFENYYSKKIEFSKDKSFLKDIQKNKNENIYVKGGRLEALKLMEEFNQHIYDKARDVPHLEATSKLSAHLKFGTISCREVYDFATRKRSKMLIRELYFRDFFTYVPYHFPHVFEGAFNKQYNNIQWENDEEKFEAWKEGKTGYPIVDAGMRQLNSTGYMHNRVRMIVASFLTKDLLINWKWGEKYFAQKLVDYDPCVNNSNWQWAASTGCDAQPYFRIFNPITQGEKFDPECKYIRKWIPQLKNYSTKEILKNPEKKLIPKDIYPLPIVDHKEESTKAKLLFKNLN